MARCSIANFILDLNSFNSIYIIALGATGRELGLLTSLILGFIASRLSYRLDIFLTGAFIGILVLIIYILAQSFI
jgi:hypothetical protein